MLRQPEAILTICREIGYTTWRDRVLTPVTTMQLFLGSWPDLVRSFPSRSLVYTHGRVLMVGFYRTIGPLASVEV
jgi:hypothetical protein